jgi:LmbE family N-acetylglucosaminyl deacetylase
MNKVLVVVAHGDDETIGMGATIARHVALGDQVKLVIMTNGVGARVAERNSSNLVNIESVDNAEKIRQLSVINATKTLGIDKTYSFDFPDNQMDTVSLLSITQAIESVIVSYEPNIIYTHSSADLNIDHVITHRAVMTACRPQPNSSVQTILSFEVRSATEWQPSSLIPFIPNYFVNITCFIDVKLKALACYEEEMRKFPHSRSLQAIKTQAVSRGASVGVEFAEAFYIERMLVS